MKKRLNESSEKNINKSDFIKSIDLIVLVAAIVQLFLLLYVVFSAYTKYSSPYFDSATCRCVFILDEDSFIVFEIAALFVGLIAGTAQFSFLHSKKKSIALTSFGIKRTKLLKNRILSGLLILFISLLLPLLIAMFLNFRFFGATAYVFQSFFVLLLVLTELNLLGFACASLGSILSSRTDETAAFSVSLAFLPKLLLTVADSILKTCLFGYSDLSSTITCFDPLKILNFNVSDYDSCNNLLSVAGCQTVNTSSLSIFKSDIIATFVWLLFLLAVCFFLPLLFNKRYAAESTGCRARSRTVNAVIRSACSSIVIIVYLYLMLYQWDKEAQYTYGKWKEVLYASVFGALAAMIASFLLHFDRKKLRKSLITFPIYMALPLLLLCLGFGGFFGFSGRLPNADTVKSVELTLPYEGVFTENSLDYWSAFNSTSLTEHSSFESGSKKDIELAKTIHQAAVSHREKKSNSMFKITYTLKNGHTFSRSYTYISNETESSMLALFESDAAVKYRRDYLFAGDSSDKNKNTESEPPQNASNYGDASCPYVPGKVQSDTDYDNQNSFLCLKNHCGEITEIKSKLTKDQYNALKEALCKDLESITIKELYTPAKKALCTLSFSQFEEGSKKYYFDSKHFFPVYESMKNTVAVLKQDGLEKYFAEGKKYTKIRLVNLENLTGTKEASTSTSAGPSGSVYCCRPYFSESLATMDSVFLKKNIAVTDPNKMAQVYKNCFTEYYSRGGGKVAVVTFNDSSEIIYFVPNAALEKIK